MATSKSILSFGEILWDLLPGGEKLGGAPFNFAYRIHSLGMDSRFASRIGNDGYGKRARQTAEALGMDCRLIQTDADHPTGTVHVRLDQNKNPDYTIVPEVAYDYILPEDELLDCAAEMDCVCFGTLAQRNTVSKNTLNQILQAAPNALKILDINLRKDCCTLDSIQTSLNVADALKLNEDELIFLSSNGLAEGDALVEQAESILRKNGLRFVVATLGERGSFVVDQAGERSYAPGFEVALADPCGSGDAFTAGFLSQMFDEKPLHAACEFGNALGALVATQDGATSHVSLEEIETLIHSSANRAADRRFA